MTDSLSVEVVGNGFNFRVPACAAITALAFLFRCRANPRAIGFRNQRMSKTPLVVGHACVTSPSTMVALTRITRFLGTTPPALLIGLDDSQLTSREPMPNLGRLPRDFANLVQDARRIADRLSRANDASRWQSDHCGRGRARAPRFSIMTIAPTHAGFDKPCNRVSCACATRWVLIVCLQSVAIVANASLDLGKLRRRLCRHAPRCRKTFPAFCWDSPAVPRLPLLP